jgi:hypothetical protein
VVQRVKKLIKKEPPSGIDWAWLKSLPENLLTTLLENMMQALLTAKRRNSTSRRRTSHAEQEHELPYYNPTVVVTNFHASQDDITSSPNPPRSPSPHDRLIPPTPPHVQARLRRRAGERRTTDF